MSSEQPYLKLRNIIKTFGSFTAIDHISLDIRHGEFICFLGPSGCGKTTLLRVIAGLEAQDSGQIIQDERDISTLPPGKRDFGIVFQSYALFPNLTVYQNIAYGLENKHLPRQQVTTRVQELLTLVSLPDSGKKFPSQLSGGQQQRIALARALALSPGLLLLDEPLSALDARVRAKLRGELAQLQRRLGVTTIMVTHDQEEALTMADRIVVIDRGTIQQIGTPLEIYQEPATPFVADFIGVMNFLSGVVIGPDKVRCGNLTLTTRPLNGTAANTAVTLAIRPEQIQIAPHPISDNGHSIVMTHVEKVEFLGPVYRLRLRPRQGTAVNLIADLPVQDAYRLKVAENMPLPVYLPAEALRVYHG